MIRAVLLDALGTLLELVAPGPALRRELRERLGVQVTEAEADRAMRAEIAFYRARLHEGRDAAAVAGLRRRCAARVRDELGDRLAGAPLGPLTDALVAALRFRPYPEVAGALGAMRAAGRRLVVVSNWDASLREALQAAGLAGLLDGAVASAEVGAAKPDPAVFRAALAVAGVPAGAALHVGDSLAEDVAGARAAGIEAVLLDRGGRDGGPVPAGVAVVSSLDELARKLP